MGEKGMNRMKKNRKTAVAAAFLALCLACLAACRGEEPSSSLPASQVPASTSSTVEAASSQSAGTTPKVTPAAATPSPSPAPTPGATQAPTATTAPEEEETWPLDLLQNGEGEFSFSGMDLGTPLDQIQEALARLGEDAPPLELVREAEDRHFGVTIAQYRLGEVELLGRTFSRELTFWDEKLHAISLQLEGGADLPAFYQELKDGLEACFDLEDFGQVELQEPMELPNGTSYTGVHTHMAASATGATSLTLTGFSQGEDLVGMGLSLAEQDNR